MDRGFTFRGGGGGGGGKGGFGFWGGGGESRVLHLVQLCGEYR